MFYRCQASASRSRASCHTKENHAADPGRHSKRETARANLKKKTNEIRAFRLEFTLLKPSRSSYSHSHRCPRTAPCNDCPTSHQKKKSANETQRERNSSPTYQQIAKLCPGERWRSEKLLLGCVRKSNISRNLLVQLCFFCNRQSRSSSNGRKHKTHSAAWNCAVVHRRQLSIDGITGN